MLTTQLHSVFLCDVNVKSVHFIILVLVTQYEPHETFYRLTRPEPEQRMTLFSRLHDVQQILLVCCSKRTRPFISTEAIN